MVKARNGGSRIKYHIQHKDGQSFLSLDNIVDDIAEFEQSQARNGSVASQANRSSAPLDSETTTPIIGNNYPGATIRHAQPVGPWTATTCLNQSQQPTLETTATDSSPRIISPGVPSLSEQPEGKRRGRPRGAKTKPKPDPSASRLEKQRGRPPGVRNKPKVTKITSAQKTCARPTLERVYEVSKNNIQENKMRKDSFSDVGQQSIRQNEMYIHLPSYANAEAYLEHAVPGELPYAASSARYPITWSGVQNHQNTRPCTPSVLRRGDTSQHFNGSSHCAGMGLNPQRRAPVDHYPSGMDWCDATYSEPIFGDRLLQAEKQDSQLPDHLPDVDLDGMSSTAPYLELPFPFGSNSSIPDLDTGWITSVDHESEWSCYKPCAEYSEDFRLAHAGFDDQRQYAFSGDHNCFWT